MHTGTLAGRLGVTGLCICAASLTFGQTTYNSTDTPKAVPDNTTTTSDIVVSDCDAISNITVEMTLAHTWIGDLTVTLTHVESGTTSDVFVRVGATTAGALGDSSNLTGLYRFDGAFTGGPSASNIWTQAAAGDSTYNMLAGDYFPRTTGVGFATGGNSTLSTAFNGEPVSGTWRLSLNDRATGDVGTLTSWSLIVTTSGGALPLATNVALDIAASQTFPVALAGLCQDGFVILSLPAQGSIADPNGGPIGAGDLPYTLLAGGNIVDYTIGAYSGPDSFTYVAFNTSGASPVRTVNLRINYGLALDEPLDVDPGWNGTAAGEWEFGDPVGSSDPPNGFTGTNVYGFNITALNTGNYPASLTPTRYLTTTAFNLTGVTSTELRFQRWLGVESSTFDHAYLDISNDGGTIWTNLFSNGATTINESAWSLQTHNISAVADNQADVRLRWGMGVTDGSVQFEGWNIDDIQIVGYLPAAAPCDPCDANCDGSVNLFDIDPFVAVLSGGAGCSPCAGDCNNDGSMNLFDIDPFVTCITGP